MRAWGALGGALSMMLFALAACDSAAGGGQPDAMIQDTMGTSDDAIADAADTMTRDASASDTTATDTSAVADTGGAGQTCPPAGPFGTQVGDVLADLTLYDCDGTAHRIADLCGRPASLLTAFAGWCPVCRGDAAQANADYLAFKAKDADFEWYYVITDSDAANSMTPTYCAAVREDYGLTMPVLLDVDGVFPAHIGVSSTNAWTVALDAEGAILAKDHYSTTNAFTKVAAELTD